MTKIPLRGSRAHYEMKLKECSHKAEGAIITLVLFIAFFGGVAATVMFDRAHKNDHPIASQLLCAQLSQDRKTIKDYAVPCLAPEHPHDHDADKLNGEYLFDRGNINAE